jgi:V/A-type H+/Na+-transporting ATPase subunit D
MDRAPATRMALLELRARRDIARRGREHLSSKRQALATELFAVVARVMAERERLDERLREAARMLALARALDGEEALESLALAGAREVPLDVEQRAVWGIPVPVVRAPRLTRAPDARGASPLDLPPVAVAAAERHEEALETLLGVCSDEVRLRRVGEEIRRTSRQINALDELVVPALAAEIDRIDLVLEERAREDLTRLKHFKRRRATAGP